MECPLSREADKTVVASIRLAGGCEGSHDLVDAGFKPGDRERLLKKRKWGRVLTHRLIIIDAAPCAYIVTFVPSVLRWRLAETKPGARRTETSVASIRSSTSRRWFAGSTVNTLIRVITSFFA